jgi:hypothetical protein
MVSMADLDALIRDFVNPGLLETYSTFRKEFENPIVKSRQPGASKKDVEKGKARNDEVLVSCVLAFGRY